MTEYSSFFISHGAPTLLAEDSPARRHLTDLGKQLGTPKAILVISAHHHSRGSSIAVTSSVIPETIMAVGIIVALMNYAIMPVLKRVFRRWINSNQEN